MADELKILSQFICSFSLDQMTPDVIQRTRGCVLDTLGAALGASGSCEVRKIAECYSKWTGLGTNGSSAALWGLGCRANLLSALMINGLMSHELELDDVHTQSKSHIGAVVIPSAWTIADAPARNCWKLSLLVTRSWGVSVWVWMLQATGSAVGTPPASSGRSAQQRQRQSF